MFLYHRRLRVAHQLLRYQLQSLLLHLLVSRRLVIYRLLVDTIRRATQEFTLLLLLLHQPLLHRLLQLRTSAVDLNRRPLLLGRMASRRVPIHYIELPLLLPQLLLRLLQAVHHSVLKHGLLRHH
jgi:hypothetical protein